MEEFISYSKIVVGVLGHKVFEAPVVVRKTNETKQVQVSPIFRFKGKCEANGVITNEGFVVLKGSQISNGVQKSCPKGIIKLREQYKDKIIKDVLMKNIVFNSSSAAAAFVGGSSLSGNICWRTDEDKCPKDYGM